MVESALPERGVTVHSGYMGYTIGHALVPKFGVLSSGEHHAYVVARKAK